MMSYSSNRRESRQARYERACWWLDRGVDIVPIKPRSKQLQRGYGPRKTHITDQDFARKWFLNTDANLGVVLGGNAGLVVADWDDVGDYEAWYEAPGALVNTLSERTARGFHLFFIGEGLITAAGDGCEFKAKGVCMVSPSVHPTGFVYRLVNDAPIARLDREGACQLFPFLSEALKKKEQVHRRASSTGTADGNPRRGLPSDGGVIARIKAAQSILDEMDAVGVELRPGGENTLVGLCPFHDDHSPSLWVNPESGLWGCNKPSCPAAGVHDVINFRALAKGISNSAAIKQLAHEFL